MKIPLLKIDAKIRQSYKVVSEPGGAWKGRRFHKKNLHILFQGILSILSCGLFMVMFGATMNSGMKVEFEGFDGKESFSIWKVRVEDLLVQLGLNLALEKKLEDMMEK